MAPERYTHAAGVDGKNSCRLERKVLVVVVDGGSRERSTWRWTEIECYNAPETGFFAPLLGSIKTITTYRYENEREPVRTPNEARRNPFKQQTD